MQIGILSAKGEHLFHISAPLVRKPVQLRSSSSHLPFALKVNTNIETRAFGMGAPTFGIRFLLVLNHLNILLYSASLKYIPLQSCLSINILTI